MRLIVGADAERAVAARGIGVSALRVTVNDPAAKRADGGSATSPAVPATGVAPMSTCQEIELGLELSPSAIGAGDHVGAVPGILHPQERAAHADRGGSATRVVG